VQFLPNESELALIQQILPFHSEEYAVVRLTETMLHKAIIDASAPIRSLLKEGSGIDYDLISQGTEGKITASGLVLENEVHSVQVSYYRPLTKKGDPRLWIYGLKKYVRDGDMIFLTIHKNNLVVIPLTRASFNLATIKGHFGEVETNIIKMELIELLSALNLKGPVLSVSPNKKYAKDVGDTFERELGMSPNSNKLADFKSTIELKAKRAGSRTNDTLFSMVPDWTISNIRSSNEMIRQFGYLSKKYPDFIDLFVTVNHTKNRQGLYLEVDEEQGYLYQFYEDLNGKKTLTCLWRLDEIRKRLFSKHPETVWVIADEIELDDGYHFHYNKAVYTRAPIFSSFLLLISQGIITYDWRGRVKPDGTEYKDKGHCFRIKPKFRHLLFVETETILLE
jgi:hypothetical protein